MKYKLPDGSTIEARREPHPSGAVNREFYQVRDLETGARIIRGDLKGTARQAIAQALRMVRRHAHNQQVSFPDMMAMARARFHDKAARNTRFDNSADAFKKFFGRELLDFREAFSFHVSGIRVLDIIRFDQWLQTPDGTSTADFIRTKYGPEAANLVKSLI